MAWTWDGNTFYDRTSKVDLIVDGNEAGKRMFDVPENGDAVTLAAGPPMTGTTLHLPPREVHRPAGEEAEGKAILVGCDNIWLFARRPADFHERVSSRC